MYDLWMEPPILETNHGLFWRKIKGFLKRFRWRYRSREKDGHLATQPAKQINKIIKLRTQNIIKNYKALILGFLRIIS